MRMILLAGALLAMSGAAWADEIPQPTENDGAQTEAAPDPEPTGCHRCVPGAHDDGFSDSDYSNPEGTYYTSAGDLACCVPGMSQDWAENTGPYDPKTGNGTDTGAQGRDKQGNGTRANGGGHDR